MKEIVYQYLKTCDGQLDLRQCATDLQLAIEDVLKAVALLEGEGRIKVEAAKAPLTEAAPTVTETKEPEDITPATPSEKMWTEPLNPPSEEAVQPSVEFTTEVAPEEAPQEQTLPPVEPVAPLEKPEVTTIEVKEETLVEPTPTIQPEVVVVEAPTETPQPQPVEAPVKEEEVTVEKPTEVAIETGLAEALAEKPTTQPMEPSISPVETTTTLEATLEPTVPAIKAPEKQPTPKKSIEPIVITEGQIILEKPVAPKTNPAQETQQVQQVENTPTIQPTAVAPKPPLPKITPHAVCTNCGLPTNTLLKQWSIKGRIAKKSVLISLYKCPTCGTVFRSAETIEAEA